MCYEIGRLAQGWKENDGLSAIILMKREKILNHEKITHVRLVCDIRLAKKYLFKSHRTRLTIGDNLIEC